MNDFTRGYLTAALWVNDPKPGAGEYEADLSRIPDGYLRNARLDCATFQQAHADLLAQAGTDEQNGHDFYLTRNHHGAGFWDRGYAVGEQLSRAAHDFGTTEVEDTDLFYEEGSE